MRFITCLAVALAVAALSVSCEQQQQRVLRRVIKSTPTASNLGRVRLVHVRSSPSSAAEVGAVAEISSKEAASFGQRSANETATSGTKSSAKPTSTTTTTTTTSTQSPSTTKPEPTTTVATPAPESPSTESSEPKHKASERQQLQPTGSHEVELLSVAPSSWQMMSAVEAPAAMLIATGTRAAASTSDLSSASSTLHSTDESASTGDFLRAGATKGASSYTTTTQHQSNNAETFSRLRQQHQTKQIQQQSFFYPQQQVRAASKTSNYQATKTNWYQPTSTTTTTTTPRPAPLIQQQQEQQYEQQNEQYVEQQQEYGAAPLGQAEPFAFDFRTQDNSGNGQYRKEESDKNGVVRGSYGYTDANGIYRHVDYVADHNGFRANIKSNEPGLIGETQPASIQLAGGATPPANNQRLTSPEDSGDWAATTSNSNNQGSSADLALAPPDFESSHKSDRLRSPRHFRN